jgi:SAM-dependent methyltransferase
VRLFFEQGQYYRFGLKIGLANLFCNGWNLGIKKTLGKIFQPVNFYSRFPEYFYFEQALAALWINQPAGKEIRILDVGSPKLFGLYLAYHYPVKIWLTDFNILNIDEYCLLWGTLSEKAAGKIEFGIQDGRRLTFPDQMFDGVYAMSVIEHINGNTGDGEACAEMLRVLRPGGRLTVSVPFGSCYVEQQCRGLKGAVEKVTDNLLYFFQRIYDPRSFIYRLSEPLQPQLDDQQLTTVYRRNLPLVKTIHWLYDRLGENLMGFLGFFNPLQSKLCNIAETGVKTDFFTRYTPIHSMMDIYADLIWSVQKKQKFNKNTNHDPS